MTSRSISRTARNELSHELDSPCLVGRWNSSQQKTYSKIRHLTRPPSLRPTAQQSFADIQHEWMMNKLQKENRRHQRHSRSGHDEAGDELHSATNKEEPRVDFNKSYSVVNHTRNSSFSTFTMREPQPRERLRPTTRPALPMRRAMTIRSSGDVVDAQTDYSDVPDTTNMLSPKLDYCAPIAGHYPPRYVDVKYTDAGWSAIPGTEEPPLPSRETMLDRALRLARERNAAKLQDVATSSQTCVDTEASDGVNENLSRQIENARTAFSWKTVITGWRSSFMPRKSEDPSQDVVGRLQRSYLHSIDQRVIRKRFFNYCNQDKPLKFQEVYTKRVLENCSKVGEGTYSEVFKIFENEKPLIVKVIPIEGTILYNGSEQKKMNDLLLEMITARVLSNLRADPVNKCSSFMRIQAFRCVVGKYPSKMMEAWKSYDRHKKSENDNPNMFKKDQLYVAIIGKPCGICLENSMHKISPKIAWSVMWQLSIALAIAEKAVEFEHRDLHLGNVLLKPTNRENVSFILNGIEMPIPSFGYRLQIIDYSLSRICHENRIIYVDLKNDQDLFEGKGAQYEVYRTMRSCTKNSWKPFNPITNINWLSYIGRKLVEGTSSRNVGPRLAADSRRLEALVVKIDKCISAFDFVSSNYVDSISLFEIANDKWEKQETRMKRTRGNKQAMVSPR